MQKEQWERIDNVKKETQKERQREKNDSVKRIMQEEQCEKVAWEKQQRQQQ